ncbi:hypothetical protein [Micromonospora sp. NPDC005652]|uniref:hypothetical protein n=1 Tax=Micromonospora sp. NPDC005652 TaxID=3157046 RepID=UPI0033E4E6FC
MSEPMTSRRLAQALNARRDNDVAVSIGTSLVPVTGVHYAPAPDRCVLTLDEEEAEGAAWAASGQAVLDSAWHSVWLHGDWFWLTRSMTTEEREAAAAAVRRHSDMHAEPGESPLDDRALRWWAPEYRYNRHGVDTCRIVPRAQVDIYIPGLGLQQAQVQRRGATAAVVAYGPVSHHSTVDLDDIRLVVSSPVDDVLARMDAHDNNDSEEA